MRMNVFLLMKYEWQYTNEKVLNNDDENESTNNYAYNDRHKA